MKATTSERQIAANRWNAQRSTGPRTAEGRAVSKMNALKHGIFSPQVVVQGLTLQENKREWRELQRRFREDLQPDGPLEEMLVDQIVTAHWRLRRALRAESGEVALSVDAAQRRCDRRTSLARQWMKWMAQGDPVPAMEQSALGNRLLRDWLRELRAAVEAEGGLTDGAVKKLAGHFGGKPNRLVKALESMSQKWEVDAAAIDPAARERQKMEVLAFLDEEIGDCQLRLECCADEEGGEEQARAAAAELPSGEVLDKILRYETKLERQMYRAMTQLERVQRLRRGEAIPAPLSIEVSGREVSS